METRFWAATIIYYLSIIGAIFSSPNFIFITAFLFLYLPSLTEAELFPGIEDQLEIQLKLLKHAWKK